MSERMKLSDLGPRVLGRKLYEQLQAEKAASADVLGPRVVGKKQATVEPVSEVEHDPAEKLSIRALQAALANDPGRVDDFLLLEILDPRKTAIRALLKAEKASASREEVIAQLQQTLERLT